MQFDFLDKLHELTKETIKNDKNEVNIEDKNISKDEIALAKKLDAIEEFSIDRFEGDIVVLENRKNGNKINIDKNKLPEGIKEGSIVKRINGKYIFDNQETLTEAKRIKNKMNDLWN